MIMAMVIVLSAMAARQDRAQTSDPPMSAWNRTSFQGTTHNARRMRPQPSPAWSPMIQKLAAGLFVLA